LSQRRSPLIEPDELQALVHDDAVRVADVRWYLDRPRAGRAAYDDAHIPGAVFIDLDVDLADPDGLGAPGRHPLPSPGAFAGLLEELGFGSDDLIVAYDDLGGTIAARLWWMLDNLGHRGGAAVLNGGIQAWQRAGYELTADVPARAPGRIDLAAQWSNVVVRSELATRLGTIALLDARAPERYRGEVEPIDPVAGHIPSALNAPAAANVDASGRLKSSEELRAAYLELIDSAAPVVVSCGSGVTACHDILAMRLAGLPDPALYVGSYSDWSRSGMPVALGSEPGDVATADIVR
jgi:thiosulfate/3-mercaptopyruvate sulfurtransferase